MLTNWERDEIKAAAEFLDDFGYTQTEDEYSISYKLDDICISIVCPPNADESDIIVRFIEKNAVFSVGWIALVRDNIKARKGLLANMKALLKYIEEKYFQITDYRFCLESDLLIDQYVEAHRDIYDKAVQDFLNKI